MKKFKNILIYLLLAVFTFSVTITPAAKAETFDSGILAEEAKKYDFQIIENTDDIITAKAKYEGQELYATLDKRTSEYTMKSVEKPQNLFGIGKDIVTEYAVEVEEISSDYETVNAVMKEKKSGKKFKLEKSKKDKKVKAQIPLIPIATWAGSSLLAWLAMQAAAITIAGVTAYAVTTVWSKMKESGYDYYTAYLDSGKTDVFIGPALKNKTAAIAHLKTGNTENYNVFATSKTLASGLADSAGKIRTNIHHTNSQHGAGYYSHYHPVDSATDYGTYYGNKVNRKNHIWYK